MISDHDLALIAQLADGTIAADAEAAARALVESNPAARAEYEAQLLALSALRGAPPARLTTAERAALHDALVDQLGLAPAAEPVPTRRRRTLPWGGLAVAAAALIGVVVLAPLLALLSTGGGDSADTTTDVMAAEAPAPTEPAEQFTRQDEVLDSEEAPLGAPAPAATGAATTVAPAATDALADTVPRAAESDDALPYLGILDADRLATLQARVEALPGDARAWRFDLAEAAGATPAADALLARLREQSACAEGVPDGFTAEAVAIAEVSGLTAVLYRLQSTDDAVGPVLLVLELDTCSELAGVAGG